MARLKTGTQTSSTAVIDAPNGERDRVFDAYRRWGYLEADLDPLGFLRPAPHSEETFLLPMSAERGLPDLPPEGLATPEDSRKAHRVSVLTKGVDSEFGPGKYSYTITNVRRNIYRIPIS